MKMLPASIFAAYMLLHSADALGWDIKNVLPCVKCAAFGEGEGSECHYKKKAFYRTPGNRALCDGGCIHIVGSVVSAQSMNEEWRQTLTDLLIKQGKVPNFLPPGPYIKDEPPPEGFNPSLDRIPSNEVNGQLSGKEVSIKACGNEVPMDKYGCHEMTANGIKGTFCKCIDNMCNIYNSVELTKRLDAESGKLNDDSKFPYLGDRRREPQK